MSFSDTSCSVQPRVSYFLRRTGKRRVVCMAGLAPHVPLREAACALSGTDAVVNPHEIDEEDGEFMQHITRDGSEHPLTI